MTLQESFTHICRNLIAASAPSVYWNDPVENICQYRGKDGVKCAIGWLIPDEYYHPDMEGRGVQRLLQDHPELRREVPFIQPWRTHDLVALQQIHDDAALGWHPGMDWGSIIRANLAAFAFHNGLKMEV
jgi:hypothetical protein